MKYYEIEMNEEILDQIYNKDYIGIFNLEYIDPEDEMIFISSFENKIFYLNDQLMDSFKFDKSKYNFFESNEEILQIDSDELFEFLVGISKDKSRNSNNHGLFGLNNI